MSLGSPVDLPAEQVPSFRQQDPRQRGEEPAGCLAFLLPVPVAFAELAYRQNQHQ